LGLAHLEPHARLGERRLELSPPIRRGALSGDGVEDRDDGSDGIGSGGKRHLATSMPGTRAG
jgi:hypothetical protein